MITISVTIFVVTLLSGLSQAGKAPEIFLPPDADVVNIVGNNFKIRVEQFNDIKDNWNKVSEEVTGVENPRRGNEDNAAVDQGLYERVKVKGGDVSYGILDDELQRWIEERASALIDRIDNHQEELRSLKDAERTVVQILLLNTQVDLENLSKETDVFLEMNSKLLKRIRIKLRQLGKDLNAHSQEVASWVEKRIIENKDIERKMKGTNKPNDNWIANVYTIMRVRHEQRFSSQISDLTSNYLGGKLNMMTRLRLYEIYKNAKKSNDILYYKDAKGRVPAHFPFSSQYAIAKGQ